jgi:hypothetical protein
VAAVLVHFTAVTEQEFQSVNSALIANVCKFAIMKALKYFWLGWGSFFVAGGGAYFFAKRNYDARLEGRQRKKHTT